MQSWSCLEHRKNKDHNLDSGGKGLIKLKDHILEFVLSQLHIVY